MPFLGQDWRCPGEQWVRTTEGWERLQMWRLRLLENLNENMIERLLKLSTFEDVMPHQALNKSHPHVRIMKGTRERKMQTSISEAFHRLDMTGAVKDVRRFNYVCKVLEILLRDKLPGLSGTAQKIVFGLLETVLTLVIKTQNNKRMMQTLLDEASHSLKNGKYILVGSTTLWHKHYESLDKMQNSLNSLQTTERLEDGKLTISDLPDDCVRLILARMADHKDIINTGMTEIRNQFLASDAVLWRDLCVFHFDDHQIYAVLKKGESDMQRMDWKKLYARLVKRYGMKDVYAEMLYMCRNCQALYWNNHGHPCLCPDLPAKAVPVPPVMFIQLFNA